MNYSYTLTAEGYTLECDGQTVSEQPFVPGVEGFVAFKDEDEKRFYAEQAIEQMASQTPVEPFSEPEVAPAP